VGFSNGWKKVPPTLRRGGNDFRTRHVIAVRHQEPYTCLGFEDNQDSLRCAPTEEVLLSEERGEVLGHRAADCGPALVDVLRAGRAPTITVSGSMRAFSALLAWRTFFQHLKSPRPRHWPECRLKLRKERRSGFSAPTALASPHSFRILATLLVPTRGRARVADTDTVQQSREVRRRLGYHAGTDHGFYARLTARENLLFFCQLNLLSSSAAAQRISQLAEQFQLGQVLDRQVRTLSTGTVQRLSLTRALLHGPSVLLLDEPTRSLDAIAASEFRRFLKSEILRYGQTSLLFASHHSPRGPSFSPIAWP